MPNSTQTTQRPAQILVAEDDEALREVVVMALRARGYDVTEARSEQDLLRHLRDPSGLDVLVVDAWMARVGGTDADAVVKALDLGLGVVFLTGEHTDDVRRDCAALPSDRILHKPFDLRDLEDAVARAYECAAVGATEAQPN